MATSTTVSETTPAPASATPAKPAKPVKKKATKRVAKKAPAKKKVAAKSATKSKPASRSVNKDTKKYKAMMIVKRMSDRKQPADRATILTELMAKVDLTKSGAATYYQNIKSGAWAMPK